MLPVTRLPAEATPENVPISITDTSSRVEDRQKWEEAVRASDVVVLLFAPNRRETLTR